MKENVPQAKQAEKAITSAPDKAKKADAQVKQAVPQAKQLEKAVTPVRHPLTADERAGLALLGYV